MCENTPFQSSSNTSAPADDYPLPSSLFVELLVAIVVEKEAYTLGSISRSSCLARSKHLREHAIPIVLNYNNTTRRLAIDTFIVWFVVGVNFSGGRDYEQNRRGIGLDVSFVGRVGRPGHQRPTLETTPSPSETSSESPVQESALKSTVGTGSRLLVVIGRAGSLCRSDASY